MRVAQAAIDDNLPVHRVVIRRPDDANDTGQWCDDVPVGRYELVALGGVAVKFDEATEPGGGLS